MHHFHYRQGRLYCEEVDLHEIANQVGTPFYCYSHATLTRHFQAFDTAFAAIDHLTCFSVKACSNIAILNLFATMGAGMDVVSGGELYRALKAGVAPERIVFSGVGKSEAEINAALDAGILMFNVESSQEMDAINYCAGRRGRKAPVAIRVNPDVDPRTHPYISTGLKTNKFGIDMDLALEEYRRASRLPHVDIVGIDCHIGSQVTEVEPFVDALLRLKEMVKQLASDGIHLRYLDLGGGLGISYESEQPPHPREYARVLTENLDDLHCCLIFEPGRVIVGNAGILVARVLYTKKTSVKNFVIVDAGMNDLIRPSLYGSYHHIQPLREEERPRRQVDVVGPICESSDFLARDRDLPEMRVGDLLAVMSAGAYGFVMASNYNSRPRPAEVLVKGNQYQVIRQRESLQDLIHGESIPAAMS